VRKLVEQGTWSSGGNLNTGRYDSGSASQSNATAALIFAGETYTPPTGALNTVTESYNGTSWTELNDLSTPRRQSPGGFGTQTSAICVSGGVPLRPHNGTAAVSNVEEWDGSTWTEIADVNTGRTSMAGGGTVSDALFIAGAPNQALTEQYNGTSWTEIADLALGRRSGKGGSSPGSSSAIIMGGDGYDLNPANAGLTTTEEWLAPTGPVTKTFTTS
jgi:hypothetical protein